MDHSARTKTGNVTILEQDNTNLKENQNPVIFNQF